MKLLSMLLHAAILSASPAWSTMDVTTIYRNFEVNPLNITLAECHSRTSALGLPFLSPNGTAIDPQVGVIVPSCHHSDCPWLASNWDHSGGSRLPPVVMPTETWKVITKNSMSTYIPLTSPHVEFSVRTTVTGRSRVILLADRDVTKSPLYVIDVAHNKLHAAHLASMIIKCGSGAEYRQRVTVAPGKPQRSCYPIGNYFHSWDREEEVRFRLDIGSDNLQLYRVGDSQPLLDGHDSRKLKVKYMAVASEGVATNWTILMDPAVWLLTKSGGWLRSPTIRSTTRKTCVSFFSYLKNRTASEVQVSVKLHDGTKISYGKIHTQNQKEDEWELQRLILDISGSKVFQIHIEGKSDVIKYPVAVHGIMGCNPFDNEDIAVIEVPETNHRFTCNVIVETSSTPTVNLSSSKCRQECLHGGVCSHVTESCVCPPGFTGLRCEQGCGHNSFGRDCEGRCSGRLNGCWGLHLCGPLIGCNCAPGFAGQLCNNSCEEGKYGVNCMDSCGACGDNSTCEVYTGVCHHGCSAGYSPPLCRQPCRYLTAAPNVSAVDFFGANVSFWAHPAAMAGEGKPKFFQIQFKSASDVAWLKEAPKLLPVATAALTSRVTHRLESLEPGKNYTLRALIINHDGCVFDTAIPTTSFLTDCVVPKKPQYNLNAVWKQRYQFDVEWQYSANMSSACDVISYHVFVTEGWRQYLYTTTTESHLSVPNRSPHFQYRVHVQAVTSRGLAPLADPVFVVTDPAAPSQVQLLGFSHVGLSPTELEISWDRPRQLAGPIDHYNIEYQCVRLFACDNTSCSESAGSMTSTATEVRLANLYAHAQYVVRVSAYTIEAGPESRIVVTTDVADPETSPSSHPDPITAVSSNSFTVSWLPSNECHLLNGYPIGYRYQLFALYSNSTNHLIASGNSTIPSASFSGLLSSQEYEVRVQQVTTKGLFSVKHELVIPVKTRGMISPAVSNLRVVNVTDTTAAIAWDYPRNISMRLIRSFVVLYNCERLLSCPTDDKCGPQTVVNTLHKSMSLEGLKPYADIRVQVSAVIEELGEYATINLYTKPANPSVAPSPASSPITDRGISWVAVEWLPPANCSLLRGPLTGYQYRLLTLDEIDPDEAIILQGQTTVNTTSYNFTNLPPHTHFVVQVFAIVDEVRVSEQSLDYTIWTRSKVPSAVEDLVVYRRSYDRLGLRWKAPEYTRALMDSVILKYRADVGYVRGEDKLRMVRCAVWSKEFCHDLIGLAPDTRYMIEIRVWNADNNEEGLPANITSITNEEAPEAPAFLRVVNKTATSVFVAWGYPYNTNGILRSFHIVYQQYRSYQIARCCDPERSLIIPVTEDKPEYVVQIANLRPASSYWVKVTAVTSHRGPQKKVSVSTRPGYPYLTNNPPLLVPGSVTRTTAEVYFRPQTGYTEPISAYFLVLIEPRFAEVDSNEEKVVSKLKKEMEELIGQRGYVCMELPELDADNHDHVTVKLGTGTMMYGVHGQYYNKPLKPDTQYTLRMVVMAEYKGDRSYSYIDGDTFTTLA